MITRPYPRVNGLKTIPFPAAHTRIASIWEYPFPRGPDCVTIDDPYVRDDYVHGNQALEALQLVCEKHGQFMYCIVRFDM